MRVVSKKRASTAMVLTLFCSKLGFDSTRLESQGGRCGKDLSGEIDDGLTTTHMNSSEHTEHSWR
jgi:hypothetical protein